MRKLSRNKKTTNIKNNKYLGSKLQTAKYINGHIYQKSNKKSNKLSKKIHTFINPNNLQKLINSSLYHKYNKNPNKYNIYLINNIIFNRKSRLVAKFKDFLLANEKNDFILKYYDLEESITKLIPFLLYYNLYSKVFPNYCDLPEGKYIYKNIRQKQRVIDIQEHQNDAENLRIVDNNLENSSKKIISSKILDSILNQTNKESILILFNIDINKKNEDEIIFEQGVYNIISEINNYYKNNLIINDTAKKINDYQLNSSKLSKKVSMKKNDVGEKLYTKVLKLPKIINNSFCNHRKHQKNISSFIQENRYDLKGLNRDYFYNRLKLKPKNNDKKYFQYSNIILSSNNCSSPLDYSNLLRNSKFVETSQIYNEIPKQCKTNRTKSKSNKKKYTSPYKTADKFYNINKKVINYKNNNINKENKSISIGKNKHKIKNNKFVNNGIKNFASINHSKNTSTIISKNISKNISRIIKKNNVKFRTQDTSLNNSINLKSNKSRIPPKIFIIKKINNFNKIKNSNTNCNTERINKTNHMTKYRNTTNNSKNKTKNSSLSKGKNIIREVKNMQNQIKLKHFKVASRNYMYNGKLTEKLISENFSVCNNTNDTKNTINHNDKKIKAMHIANFSAILNVSKEQPKIYNKYLK